MFCYFTFFVFVSKTSLACLSQIEKSFFCNRSKVKVYWNFWPVFLATFHSLWVQIENKSFQQKLEVKKKVFAFVFYHSDTQDFYKKFVNNVSEFLVFNYKPFSFGFKLKVYLIKTWLISLVSSPTIYLWLNMFQNNNM